MVSQGYLPALSDGITLTVGAGFLLGVAVAGFLWLNLYRTFDEGYKKYDTIGDTSYEGRIDPPSEERDRFWSWATALKISHNTDRYEGRGTSKTKSVSTPIGNVFGGILLFSVCALGIYYQNQNPSVYPTWSRVGARAIAGAAVGLTVGQAVPLVLGALYYTTVTAVGTIVGTGAKIPSALLGAVAGSGSQKQPSETKPVAESGADGSSAAGDRTHGETGTDTGGDDDDDDLPLDPSRHTVEQLRSGIDDVDDPEALRAVLRAERRGDDRKTAKRAIGRRLPEPFDPRRYTVSELREEIDEVDDRESLRALLDAEESGKDRKTAKRAIQKRLEEVASAQSPAQPEADPDVESRERDRGDERRSDAGSDGEPVTAPVSGVDSDFGDYDRQELIGSGGNADVYRARAEFDGEERTVALKIPRFPESETLDASVFERFVREAETWAKLDDHPHVVTVYDWGTTPQPWLALEYMGGGSLGPRTPVSPERGRDVLLAVAEAVEHAHRNGVVHGDLKPENVLFTDDDRVKVGDWGLARVLLDHSQSTEGLSPAYAAPEQFDDGVGDAADYQRVDIYQLGAVAYELFTGRPPFQGTPFEVMEQIKNERPTPPSELDTLPGWVDDIVLRALAKDPTDRYETVVHLKEDIER